jgi:protease IV
MALMETEEVMRELLSERRKERWFKLARTLLWIVLFVWIFSAFDSGDEEGVGDAAKGKPYVNLIDLEGTILPGANSASLRGLDSALKRAFSDENAKGVIIRVNSPGGSPVQSDLIRGEIKRLSELHDKRVVVVGEEMLTSGAYLVSLAGDKIYAHPSALVGSIGVRMDSFGAVELIDKIGVERRIYQSGENKVGLDVFLPEDEKDVSHIKSILEDVHEQFIDAVVSARPNLEGRKDELMTGLYWTGRKGAELGLIDGVGTVSSVMKSEFDVNHYVAVKPELDILSRLTTTLSSIGTVTSQLFGTSPALKSDL